MNELALTLPTYGKIAGPSGVPSGGLFPVGQNIVQMLVQLGFIFAIILSLIFMILAGIDWITSGGDKQGLEKARAKLTYAIVGLVIVLFSIFIVNLVESSLGIRDARQNMFCGPDERLNPITNRCEPSN